MTTLPLPLTIVAQQGPDVLLLALAPDAATASADPRTQGMVLDLRSGRWSQPPTLLQTILARGYWQPYIGETSRPTAQVDALVQQIAAAAAER